MPEIPECLNRRYKALDQLIRELSAMPNQGFHENRVANKNTHEPGIKLMCDFWNILKEDPGCDLSQAVKQHMGLETQGTSSAFPNEVACFVARRDGSDRSHGCESHSGKNRDRGEDARKALDRVRKLYRSSPCSTRSKQSSVETVDKSYEMPLSKALCSLKEAASLDKKCNLQVLDLMETQRELKAQIDILEQREKEGMELLEQADEMWTTMEEEYKQKIAQSIDRQKEMLKQLKEVEANNAKWRRNKKDLEDQIKTINKCHHDITEKISHKNNDIKCIELEISQFTNRIQYNKRTEDSGKQNLLHKKTASDKKMAGYNAHIVLLKSELASLQAQRKDKEAEGSKFVSDAREDMQQICRTLLQKKMENEEHVESKKGLIQEIELLKQTCDQCKDKCSTKRSSLNNEIKRIDKEIADYRYQCVKCHQCTDTEDARRLCSDCPRCKEPRECTTLGDHCERDASYDCVCVHVKEKFLNNVFENMYTVLERQSRSKPGKVLAESIVKSLNNSRNGKLDGETRRLVQDFVLNSVRKNLNLTIVGGAVKTRCELDPKIYGELMSCLKTVKVVEPPKEDRGTDAKKDPCRRWGGSQECNCPGGANECICLKRGPPLRKEPTPYPPVPEKEDYSRNRKNAKVRCPVKEPETCGSDCGVYVEDENAEETANMEPNTFCKDNECPFERIVRGAQCSIGPEALSSEPSTYIASVPCVPAVSRMENKKSCKCGGTNPKICKCGKDKTSPRERVIDEIMGKYSDETSNQNVHFTGGQQRNEKDMKKDKLSRHSLKVCKNRTSEMCDCSSDVILIEGTDALIEMLRRKNETHVCKTIWNKVTNGSVKLSPEEMSTEYSSKSNSGVQIILHPRFRANNEKCVEKPRPPKKYFRKSLHSNCSKISKNSQCVGGKAFSKNSSYLNEEMGGNVRELLDNIIKLDTNNSNHGVKWMSVNSLIQLISLKINKTEHNNSVTTSCAESLTNPKHEKICNFIKQNDEKPRQHKSQVLKITETNTSNRLPSRGDDRKKHVKRLKETKNNFQENLMLSQHVKSKLLKNPVNEFRSWKYFQQAMTEQSRVHQNSHNVLAKLNNRNSNQTSVAKVNTKKSNKKTKKSNNIKPKLKQNLKNKTIPEVTLTTNFMTWLRNKTIKHRPKTRDSDNYKMNRRVQRSKTISTDIYIKKTSKDKSKLSDSDIYKRNSIKHKPKSSISDNYKSNLRKNKLRLNDSHICKKNSIKHYSKSNNSDTNKRNQIKHNLNLGYSDNYKRNPPRHKPKSSYSDSIQKNQTKGKPKTYSTDNYKINPMKQKPNSGISDNYKRNSIKHKQNSSNSDSLIRKPTDYYKRNPNRDKPKTNNSDNYKRNPIKQKPNSGISDNFNINPIKPKPYSVTSDNYKRNPIKRKPNSSYSDSLIKKTKSSSSDHYKINPNKDKPKTNNSDNYKRNPIKPKRNSGISDNNKRNPIKHKPNSSYSDSLIRKPKLSRSDHYKRNPNINKPKKSHYYKKIR